MPTPERSNPHIACLDHIRTEVQFECSGPESLALVTEVQLGIEVDVAAAVAGVGAEVQAGTGVEAESGSAVLGRRDQSIAAAAPVTTEWGDVAADWPVVEVELEAVVGSAVGPVPGVEVGSAVGVGSVAEAGPEAGVGLEVEIEAAVEPGIAVVAEVVSVVAAAGG